MQKIRSGTNADGSPHYLYVADEGEHLVVTGPYITGEVTLADGTVVDVNDPVIVVDSPAQALAVSDAIGERFAAEGHPTHDGDEPFVATPSALTHDATTGEVKEAFVDTLLANPTLNAQELIDVLSPSDV